MYVPGAFSQADPLEIERFVDRHPLGTIVRLVDRRSDADHLPFGRMGDLAPGERMISHAARANPVWRLGESRSDVLPVFAGAEADVSPSHYRSKAEHHQVVPTCNYAAVPVRGILSCSQHRTPADRRGVVAGLRADTTGPCSLEAAEFVERSQGSP